MQDRDDDEFWALKQICVAYILLPTYRNETYNNMPANILLLYTPSTPGLAQNIKHFSEEGHVVIKIQGKKFRSLCKQTFELIGLGIKARH